MREDKIMRPLKLLLSLLFFGYGSWLLYQGLYPDYQPVPATVSESYKEYIDTYPDRPGRYYYTFKYEYTYRGERYVSEQYTYGGRNSSEAVCRYKSGDSLVAYVNPKKPDFAIIKRSISGFIVALTLVGFLMLIQTVLDYFVAPHRKKANQFLQKTHNFTGNLIGVAILFGGIGYFIYTLIRAATDGCVT
jgi:hypothetical protein